jgi:hypothetical protein
MKRILITIVSVLLVTAVVGVAYAQEADDEDAPIRTAQPEAAVTLPEANVTGAPPPPVIRFVFEGTAPSNIDTSQFLNRDFDLSEVPPEVRNLLSSMDRPNFEIIKPTDERDYRVFAPNGNQFKGSPPWESLVQNLRSRSSHWSVSRERAGTGHEPRGVVLPKVYWVRYKVKF